MKYILSRLNIGVNAIFDLVALLMTPVTWFLGQTNMLLGLMIGLFVFGHTGVAAIICIWLLGQAMTFVICACIASAVENAEPGPTPAPV